jgi:hypothetical protein
VHAEPSTIRVTISADPRPVRRSVRAYEARLDDATKPHRALAVRQITDPATVTRKALGEFST